MTVRSRVSIALGLVPVLVVVMAVPAVASNDVRRVTVMTRNLYLGADINPLFAATDQASFLAAVAGLWASVVATDFPTRATALADEIAEHQPDLIGLQEAVVWYSGPLLDAAPATDVEYDFLATLLTELRARGLRYEPVSVQTNFDGEGPNVVIGKDVRLTDRDAILARVPRHGVQVSNPMNASYPAPTLVSFEHPIIGAITIVRGWTSVDVKLRGQEFRFINTHLETDDFPPAQMAQAAALLAGPANTSTPVVIVGDLNSGPGGFSGTYDLVTGAGFADAWTGGAAPTCCQASNLMNAASQLVSRIDLVLFRGATDRGFEFSSAEATRVGEDVGDKVAGLWPSDHAGVVATLALE
jgi:endonuclease/exonuclease/phosphatase family metal-dependent hydrolase